MTYIQPIKQLCPSSITYDNIRVVVAYLKIRDYLDSLNLQYKDFESPIELIDMNEFPENKENTDSLQRRPVENEKIKLLDKKDENDDKGAAIDLDLQFADFDAPFETATLNENVGENNESLNASPTEEKENLNESESLDDTVEQPKKKFKFNKFQFKEKKFNYVSILDN